MPKNIRVMGLTDAGLVRPSNEDHFGDFDPPSLSGKLGRLFIVADGVGGHRGGGLASRLAVDCVAEAYFSGEPAAPGAGESTIEDRLLYSFREANRRIHQKATEDASVHGMASTCTALVLHDGHAFIAHLGDSRAYLVRGDRIQQLTRDHSVVQYRIDAGLMTREQARTHADRNIITRSMGFEADVEPDLLQPPLEVRDSDHFVLCTDGLHGLLSDDEIAGTVRAHNPEDACHRLIDEAKHRGGPDNITVQVVRIEEA